MIEIKNLTKRFPPNVIAVNNLTLDIKTGINGLIGENGAGKSTLLRLIADVYQEDEGTIIINGLDHHDNHARNDLFFLSDDPFCNGSDNALQNMKFYSSLFELDEAKFTEMMNKLSLPLDRRVSTFSKGMRRQLFLCIALSMKANCILLDEAFDGLDPIVQDVIKEEIIMNANDKIFLVSSHNLQSLERLCDNFILLSKGRCKKEGAGEDLGQSFRKYQIIFNGDVSKEELKRNGINVVSLKKVGSITYIVTTGENDEELIKEKYKPTLIENVAIDNDEIIKLEMLLAKGEEEK